MVVVEPPYCPKHHKIIIIWTKTKINKKFIKRRLHRNNNAIATANINKTTNFPKLKQKRTTQARIHPVSNLSQQFIPIKIKSGLLKISHFLILKLMGNIYRRGYNKIIKNKKWISRKMMELDISILRFHKLMHLQNGRLLIQKNSLLLLTTTPNTKVKHCHSIQVSTSLKMKTNPITHRRKNCSPAITNIARSKSWLRTANQLITPAQWVMFKVETWVGKLTHPHCEVHPLTALIKTTPEFKLFREFKIRLEQMIPPWKQWFRLSVIRLIPRDRCLRLRLLMYISSAQKCAKTSSSQVNANMATR